MEYELSRNMRGMKPSIIREILKQMSDPSLISFAGGNPAPESFPNEEIAAASARLLAQDPAGMLQYSVTEGVPAVLEQVRRFANRHELRVRGQDALLLCTGSQQVLDLATKCLCNEGDTIAVEEPAFLGAYNTFRSYGAKLAGVPMEEDGVDLAALEAVFAAPEKPRFFYCIPNFQNPTGKTMSLAKRRGVLALARRYGVPVLEDDPYGELRFAGERVPSIKSLDDGNNVIYAASFSKILCPGMRLAFCACDETLAKSLVVAKQGSDVHTNVWAQRVCAELLRTMDMDAHIRAVSAMYGRKAALMAQLLQEKCPQVSFEMPQGGMFLWATLPPVVPVPEFVQACLDEKLAVIPGSAFYVDASAPCQGVRLNFSTPSEDAICRVGDIMARVLRKLFGQSVCSV